MVRRRVVDDMIAMAGNCFGRVSSVCALIVKG